MKVVMSFEDWHYTKRMLKKGWKVHLYWKGGWLIPTGVLWNIGAPAFTIKPKNNE